MRFSKHYFTEKKDHIIKKMPNLTSDQKEELIAYFQKKPNLEGKVDWNKWKTLTYKDFEPALEPDTFTQKRKAVKASGISGLKDGKDYLKFPTGNSDIQAYIPLTYDASRLIASNRVGGCTGEWCTAEQKSNYHWKEYVIKQNVVLVYVVLPDRKYAVAVYPDNKTVEIFDHEDKKVGSSSFQKETGILNKILSSGKLFDRAREIVQSSISIYKIFDLDESKVTKNPDGSIDYDGDVEISYSNITKIPIRFNKVTGIFSCNHNKLTSLEGAPSEIGGDFFCDINQLTSLEGAPSEVGGGFYCDTNQLTSLEGAPSKVGGSFFCNHNKLTSLEGAPSEVDEDFDCSNNQLTSLEGAPSEVGGSFYCYNNQLTSLEGAPSEVGGKFYCSNNKKEFTEKDVRKVSSVKGLVRT